MNNPTKQQRINTYQLIPLALIGLGLIVIGFVALNFILSNNSESQYSVVPMHVNFAAPELSLYDLNGRNVSLSEYHQAVVLVNNWATWCPPCKTEMPTLLKYYQEHANQGFVLIGIEAGDTKEDVISFVDEYQLTFPILLDPDEKSLTAFQNDSLPSSYVIDRNGMVVLAWTGPISKAMLEKYVTPLLE